MGSRSSSASGFDYADDRPPSARLTNADDECALAECPEDDLSEEYLQQHCSTKHLGSVTELEIQVDSTVQSIECLGHHLPGLRQLRLSNSSILGIRELGSSLTNLDVLWMSRCGLQDLDGVQVLDSLQELYLPFNDIADVSQLKWLDKLCVLDLEGNALANSKDVEELSRCYQLQDVTIRGNPVWHNEGLCRAAVLEMLPQISLLDDHPRFSNGPPEMAVQESSSHPHRYIDLYLETDLDMYLTFTWKVLEVRMKPRHLRKHMAPKMSADAQCSSSHYWQKSSENVSENARSKDLFWRSPMNTSCCWSR